MKKTTLWLIVLLSVLIIAGAILTLKIAYTFNIEKQEAEIRFSNLEQLLCVGIKPHASKEEVFSVLEQVGSFSVAEMGEDIHIVFYDAKNIDTYGVFNISFVQGKYVGAYIKTGLESIKPICSYY